MLTIIKGMKRIYLLTNTLYTQLMTLSRHQLFWPLIIMVTALVMTLLFIVIKPGIDVGSIQERAWRVTATHPQFGDFYPNLILYGFTESPRHSTLESAVEANVTATHFFEGNYVTKGEALIELDDRDFTLLVRQRQAAIAQLQAQINRSKVQHTKEQTLLTQEQKLLALTENEVNRQQSLRQKEYSSRASLESAQQNFYQQLLNVQNRELSIETFPYELAELEAELAEAQASLAKAKLDRQRTQIKAPFNGRVTHLYVSAGTHANVGEELVAIYDTDSVEVRAQIPNRYVASAYRALAEDQLITAIAYIDGQQINLQFDRLASEVSTRRGGVDGIFKIINQNPNIAIGRPVRLIVTLPLIINVYQVPSTALYSNDRIYKINQDNRLETIAIEQLGSIYSLQPSGQTSLLLRTDAPLSVDDLILTTQLPNTRQNLLVDPINETLAQPID
jgi:HlyD family secretion protein